MILKVSSSQNDSLILRHTNTQDNTVAPSGMRHLAGLCQGVMRVSTYEIIRTEACCALFPCRASEERGRAANAETLARRQALESLWADVPATAPQLTTVPAPYLLPVRAQAPALLQTCSSCVLVLWVSMSRCWQRSTAEGTSVRKERGCPVPDMVSPSWLQGTHHRTQLSTACTFLG